MKCNFGRIVGAAQGGGVEAGFVFQGNVLASDDLIESRVPELREAELDFTSVALSSPKDGPSFYRQYAV